jgi:hypothetical protein
LRSSWRAGTMRRVKEDEEATQLMLEALFDIKSAVNDIHRVLLGGDDEEEETEEDS